MLRSKVNIARLAAVLREIYLVRDNINDISEVEHVNRLFKLT